MRRVLSPEEHALWRRVTADVRTIGTAAPPPPLPVADLRKIPDLGPSPMPQPAGPVRRPAIRGPAQYATLDGKWDRELRSGQVVPDRVVDLHGCTLAQAHARALAALGAAVAGGERIVVIVTGRAPGAGTTRLDRPLRGIIRASITDWLHNAPFASSIAAIRPAHPRHGGAGALYVILRRPARG